MFSIFKKKECSYCGEKRRGTINYAGYDICSQSCMRGFLNSLSLEELIYLDKKDIEINKDFYRWINSHNKEK